MMINSKKIIAILIMLTMFAGVASSPSPINAIGITTNSTAENMISTAEDNIGKAYEKIVTLENYNVNTTSLFLMLNQSVALINHAKTVINENESKAMEMASEANSIALKVYEDAESMLNTIADTHTGGTLLLMVGVVFTILFVFTIVFHTWLAYKKKHEKELLKLKVRIKNRDEEK